MPCPFAARTHSLDDPVEVGEPVVVAEAPAGGPVRIVTDPELARAVLADPRFAKDPALAPPHWDARTAGLEPTAADQLSVTTLDGPPHTRLRRVFAPLFSAARMRAAYPMMVATARRLLAALGAEADLVEDFTTRYPLAVLCDLLGIPADRVDHAMTACRLVHTDYPDHVDQAMAAFADLASVAVTGGVELADRMPPGSTDRDLHYQVFTILFAGQLTTDPSVGFLIARLLSPPPAPDTHTAPDDPAAPDDLVDDTLRRYPPAPYTLWRFTSTEVDLAGELLSARTPVLVDIRAANAGSGDLTFGTGPHYCIGAQLARLELRAVAEAFRTDYPKARLTTPYRNLVAATPGGIMGSRLLTLPVRFQTP
ncbi:cytochrome P450 [Saccharothrix sp.]|uniref:cytochrome P450 n=1 Tax=Saccharothrix sp. TaxID=1873460 RepID=UPI002811D7E5|nr:cytochrome P450 [Saccharothrix sp.]